MKNNYSSYNDEIDLIKLFNIIWRQKIKFFIIIAISFLIGFAYNYKLPNTYKGSLIIEPAQSFELTKLLYLNKLLQINESTNLGEMIIERFIEEMMDKEEFITLFKDSQNVSEDISKLPLDKQEELYNLSRKINIVNDSKNETYVLNLQWNDSNEIKNILENTLKLTLNNLQKSIYKELDDALDFNKKIILNEDIKRLEYLSEQSLIAKELGIADIWEKQTESINSFQPSLSFNTDKKSNIDVHKSNDASYYLRGYRAIDKEIELIKNRDYKSFNIIEKEINSFKKTKINWINFNINTIDIISNKKTKRNLIISILLGIFIGFLYIIIVSALQSKSVSRKK